MRYLLDTNAVIDYLRGHAPLRTRLLAQAPGDLGVSTLTLHELERGLGLNGNPPKKRAALTAFLAQMVILPFDEDAARASGQADAALRVRGDMIGPLDVLIAGAALSASVTLVTHNVAEFSRVDGLKVEDWW
jgi:tRNA(fMet)-specific endonuclease VapC